MIAISSMTVGIFDLPVDNWIKGYMGMGLVFTIGSSFSRAKTLRERKKAENILAIVDQARVEKILAEHSPLK